MRETELNSSVIIPDANQAVNTMASAIKITAHITTFWRNRNTYYNYEEPSLLEMGDNHALRNWKRQANPSAPAGRGTLYQ